MAPQRSNSPTRSTRILSPAYHHNRSPRSNHRVPSPYHQHAGADESHVALVTELFMEVFRHLSSTRAIVGEQSLAGLLRLTSDANPAQITRALRQMKMAVHPDRMKLKLEASGGFSERHVEAMFYAEILFYLYSEISDVVQEMLQQKRGLRGFYYALKAYFPNGPAPMQVSAKVREWCIASMSGKLGSPNSDHERAVVACMGAYVSSHPPQSTQTAAERAREQREREQREREQHAREQRDEHQGRRPRGAKANRKCKCRTLKRISDCNANHECKWMQGVGCRPLEYGDISPNPPH